MPLFGLGQRTGMNVKRTVGANIDTALKSSNDHHHRISLSPPSLLNIQQHKQSHSGAITRHHSFLMNSQRGGDDVQQQQLQQQRDSLTSKFECLSPQRSMSSDNLLARPLNTDLVSAIKPKTQMLRSSISQSNLGRIDFRSRNAMDSTNTCYVMDGDATGGDTKEELLLWNEQRTQQFTGAAEVKAPQRCDSPLRDQSCALLRPDPRRISIGSNVSMTDAMPPTVFDLYDSFGNKNIITTSSSQDSFCTSYGDADISGECSDSNASDMNEVAAEIQNILLPSTAARSFQDIDNRFDAMPTFCDDDTNQWQRHHQCVVQPHQCRTTGAPVNPRYHPYLTANRSDSVDSDDTIISDNTEDMNYEIFSFEEENGQVEPSRRCEPAHHSSPVLAPRSTDNDSIDHQDESISTSAVRRYLEEYADHHAPYERIRNGITQDRYFEYKEGSSFTAGSLERLQGCNMDNLTLRDNVLSPSSFSRLSPIGTGKVH